MADFYDIYGRYRANVFVLETKIFFRILKLPTSKLSKIQNFMQKMAKIGVKICAQKLPILVCGQNFAI